MCGPLAVAGLTAALAIGQSVTSYIGGRQAFKANQKAANLTAANESNILGQQQVQLDQEKSESAFDTAIAAAQSQGRISASASEQGLGNQSLVQALNADMFGIGRQVSIEGANDQNARNQIATQRQGIELDRIGRINSVTKPSGLSLALGIGQGALSGVNAYSSAGGRLGGSKVGG